ncbi:MAG TPA: hypothetical protein VGS22_16500 [Thermoanaerobaculia bacterium]|jgi:hypothetical protein|nr:hypothetical protein [Thermoanaerobaculia bacterium]
MLEPPAYCPEIPWSVDALLLRAVHAKLAGDAILSTTPFLAGGIHLIDNPELWVLGTWTGPGALTVDIESSLEVVVGNAGKDRLDTTIRVGLYTITQETAPANDQVRSRVLNRAKGVLAAGDDGQGVYLDSDGRALNLPILRFLTDTRSGRLRKKPSCLYNELRLILSSDVHAYTRVYL